MTHLLDVFWSLGPGGAATNARVLLDQRRRDDRIVLSLSRRVAAVTGEGTHAAA